MKADTLTIKALFQRDVQYVIPTFQRPYVWTQEEQWEPLWEDVRDTADRYLEHLAGADAQRAEELAGTHFLGAVVLKQRPTPTASIEEREVIDGQQRMTTLLILLHAAHAALADLGCQTEAQRLQRLVWNRDAEGDQRFKVWPTETDRRAFRQALSGVDERSDGNTTEEESAIVQAHEFFRDQAREWVRSGTDDVARSRRAHGLETALMGLMEVVVIDLGTADDAFVIFETLNARGTPLLASDLVKNLVMQTASEAGLDPDGLHREHWRGFEVGWWRKEVRQGRISRPRIDTLIDYWLEMRLHREVASHDVFPEFRKHLHAAQDVEGILRDLRASGEAWKAIDEVPENTPVERFVYRWRTIEAGPVTPLVLQLFTDKRRGELSEDCFQRTLTVVESYLVRRMVCRMTTKDYNRLFIELLKRIGDAGPANASEAVEEFLAGQKADARLWPTDAEFSGAARDLPLYRLLTRGRLRLVLEAIEDSLRTSHSEDRAVARGLTIEHIMPRRWQTHWPLPGESSAQAYDRRERLIHSLGNLTLVTQTLNPSLSNAEWSAKRESLHRHSNLLMTRRLLDDAGQTWTEETIQQRGELLGKAMTRIWPRPS